MKFMLLARSAVNRYTPAMRLFTGRRILFILFSFLLLAGGAALYLQQLLRMDTYKEQIVAELGSALHREVSYRTGDFTLRYGPSFTFTGITITERDGVSRFLHADRLTLRIALLPLLEKKIIIKELDLDAPHIAITRNRDGAFSLSDLLEQHPSSLSLQIQGVKVSRGTIVFTDRKASEEGLTLVLSKTDFMLNRLARGKKGNISFAAFLGDGQQSLGSLSVKGKVRPPPTGVTLDHSDLDLEITTVGLDAAQIGRAHV